MPAPRGAARRRGDGRGREARLQLAVLRRCAADCASCDAERVAVVLRGCALPAVPATGREICRDSGSGGDCTLIVTDETVRPTDAAAAAAGETAAGALGGKRSDEIEKLALGDDRCTPVCCRS